MYGVWRCCWPGLPPATHLLIVQNCVNLRFTRDAAGDKSPPVLVILDHAGPVEGPKSPHAASPGLVGRLEKAGRPPGDAALSLHLEISGFLYLYATSVGLSFVIWKKKMKAFSSQGSADLTRGSLANSLGHSIKFAPVFLIQQSQAGPENDVHLIGVR